MFVLASFIGAHFVRLATGWVCKFRPPYGMAYLAWLVAYAGSLVVGSTIAFAIGALGSGSGVSALITLISFLAGAAVYGVMIKDPEHGPIGFRKGCLVSLSAGVLTAILLGSIAVVAALVIAAGLLTVARTVDMCRPLVAMIAA